MEGRHCTPHPAPASSYARASTLAPATTRSPIATATRLPAGRSTSTRDPNRISPTRSPAATAAPARVRQTMRRATRPATSVNATGGAPGPLDHDRGPLVVVRGLVLEGGEEVPVDVPDGADPARDRRAAHVHVEDVHEDGDPSRVGPDYLPVRRADDRGRVGRGRALRVAEEVEGECEQEDDRHRPPRPEPRGQRPGRRQNPDERPCGGVDPHPCRPASRASLRRIASISSFTRSFSFLSVASS